MRFRIVESFRSFLTEDIEGMRKFYPNIPEDEFMKFIKLDPTYKDGSNNAGKYARWILGLANKGSGKIENENHITDVLRRFDEEKNHLINKDIMKYKTVDDVETMLNDEASYAEQSHRQEVRARQQARKSADIKKDADIVYKDSKWTVYVPKTYAASCNLGAGSTWCTASTESDYYYNAYLNRYPGSKYYIIINNQNPEEKYQIHFESDQYMDKNDNSFDFETQFKNDEGLLGFIHETRKAGFLNQIGIADAKGKVTNDVYNADLADALIGVEYNRNALTSYNIEKVLGGSAYELFNTWGASNSDVVYALGDINEENIKEIESLGLSLEELKEEQDGEIWDAIDNALEIAYNQENESELTDSVIYQISNIADKIPWLNIDIAIGEAKQRFTINVDKLKESIDKLYENYPIEEVDTHVDLALVVIKEISDGVYEPYSYSSYDPDVFNEILADNLRGLNDTK